MTSYQVVENINPQAALWALIAPVVTAVRALALALALAVVIAGAMAVAVAVTPVVVGCCAAALPAVGQTLVMVVVVAGYAWWCKP